MMGRVPNRRRNFLVDTQMQGRFIVFLIFFLIGYNILTVLLRKLAAQIELPIFVPIYLFVMAVYIGLVGIFYSHRLAGPLFKIRQILGEVARGDLFFNIHCRKENDPVIKDISSSINETVNGFRDSIREIESSSAALGKETSELRGKLWERRNEFPDVMEHIEAIHRKEEELAALTRKYKVR
ncbi:MAG: hypothetical protein OEV28_04395 [Nitrospirota bacterium]|nr:hypothetical protein [Nitrospirota bacterium]